MIRMEDLIQMRTDGRTRGLSRTIARKEQDIVLNWIRRNILPRKTVLHGRTSYGMKHILENDTRST